MVAEKLIGETEAVARINPSSLDQLLHPMLDPKAERRVIARGLPASPGAAAGKARSEEHTSELQSLMRISYAGFCLKKKTRTLIMQIQLAWRVTTKDREF